MNGTEGAGRAGRMFGGAGLGSEAKEEAQWWELLLIQVFGRG